MRFAAVFLYALMVTPVSAALFLRADKTEISGKIRFTLWGLTACIPFSLVRHHGFFFCAGKKRIPLHVKKRRRPRLTVCFPPLKKQLHSWLRNVYLLLNVRIGTGDAAQTALLCGALISVFSVIPNAKAQIKPEYSAPVIRGTLHCIVSFRLGKLFLTFALLALATVVRSMGGRTDGNHAGKANRLGHADSP